MRRTGRLVALTLEGILLFVLIAGAVFVSVGRILVANIDAFETSIERRLSSALNVRVSFDGIEGSWEYFDPTVRFDGLIIGDGERPAISMGSVSARVNSLASLLERDLVVSELIVDRIGFDLVQTAEGSWHVVGMPGMGQSIDVSPLLASIEHLERVDIRGVDIRVEGQQRSYHLTSQPGISPGAHRGRGQKIVSMPLFVQQSKAQFSEFELVGRYRGDPRDVQSFYADLYLQLPLLELSDFMPRVNDNLAVRELVTRGEFWLEGSAGEWHLRALPVVERLVVANADRSMQVLRRRDRRPSSPRASRSLMFGCRQPTLKGISAVVLWRLAMLRLLRCRSPMNGRSVPESSRSMLATSSPGFMASMSAWRCSTLNSLGHSRHWLRGGRS
ncbi:MAG: hypothetical protein U5O39_19310 [Gammaproteobacteria bacterium]|nr:hypothetical protein [Gammaproteobacteria bacterium]